MTALSDRLNEAKGDASVDDIARRAEALGHRLDRSAFFRAFKGEHAKKPRDSTLRAWAAGLKLDVNELRRLCDLPEGEMGLYTGPDESARLNRDQRKALDRLIVTIVAQKESSDVASAAQKTARVRGAGKRAAPRTPTDQ